MNVCLITSVELNTLIKKMYIHDTEQYSVVSTLQVVLYGLRGSISVDKISCACSVIAY